MKKTTERLAWVGAIAAAAAAAVGVTLYAKGASASTAPTNQFLVVITDPNMVKQLQSGFAQALARGPTPELGITSADYTPADVDGNPANPRWMHVLQAFQKYMGTIPTPTGPSFPPNFPWPIRADGVLDYATSVAMVNS